MKYFDNLIALIEGGIKQSGNMSQQPVKNVVKSHVLEFQKCSKILRQKNEINKVKLDPLAVPFCFLMPLKDKRKDDLADMARSQSYRDVATVFVQNAKKETTTWSEILAENYKT